MHFHMHKYKLESKESNYHKHKILGYTQHTVGTSSLHFHTFYGVSSHKDHTHYFSGFTGLPVKTPNGHVHKIEEILEENQHHEHAFSGYTDEEIAYVKGKKPIQAFI